MILVDTSVWIDHFREHLPPLAGLLQTGQVLSHPLIIGELACGNLHDWQAVLELLDELPTTAEVEHPEVLAFIEQHRLMGRGVGIVDVTLLASARQVGVPLWTRDKRLCAVAQGLGLLATLEYPGTIEQA